MQHEENKITVNLDADNLCIKITVNDIDCQCLKSQFRKKISKNNY